MITGDMIIAAPPSKPPSMRSTIVGSLIVAFICARVLFKQSTILDSDTIGLFSVGLALILGSDKLLGK